MSFFNKFLNTVKSVVDSKYGDLRTEYESLQDEYKQIRPNMDKALPLYQTALNNYRAYTAYNFTLLMSGSILAMKADQFNTYLEEAALPLSSINPDRELSPDVKQNIENASGGPEIVNMMYAPKRISNIPGFENNETILHFWGLPITPFALWGTEVDNLQLGGLGVVYPGEPSSEGSVIRDAVLYASPPGQLLIEIKAVGNYIDGLFDDWEQEQAKANAVLSQKVNKLETEYYKILGATKALNDGIKKTKKRFLQLMPKLNQVYPISSINWQSLNIKTPDKDFIPVMQQAVLHYGILHKIRKDWSRRLSRNPNAKWENLVTKEVNDRDSKKYTAVQVRGLAKVVHQYVFPKSAKIKREPGQSMKDLGGKEYPTVEFEIDGKKQTWMAANLDYDAGTGSWYYDNAPANGTKYGRLYNWAAAQGSCPPGWRLPTHQEYENLIAKFGGQQAAFKALKKGGTSGFDAVMGGWATPARRGTGMEFIYLGWAYYWTDTSWPEYNQAWYFAYNIQDSKVEMLHGYDKSQGFSVRYIKNN